MSGASRSASGEWPNDSSSADGGAGAAHVSTAARGEGAASAGLGGGADAVTEPDGLEPRIRHEPALPAVRCSAIVRRHGWIEKARQQDPKALLLEIAKYIEAMPTKSENQFPPGSDNHSFVGFWQTNEYLYGLLELGAKAELVGGAA